MSVEVTTWVWDNSTASGNDLIVLLKIADNANADGGGAYPGVDYLAKKARISRRAVYDCLRRLKASGELAEEIGGGGRGRKTTYRVLMQVSPNGADVAPIPEANGAARRAETVQPAALNGADEGIAYKEEPSLNRPKNRAPSETAASSKNGKTAHALLKQYINSLPATPPERERGHLARTITGLLDEGLASSLLWQTLDQDYRHRDVGPAYLPNLVAARQRGATRSNNGNGRGPSPSVAAAERERALAVTQAKLARSGRPPVPSGAHQ